jgi:hypothetical protein
MKEQEGESELSKTRKQIQFKKRMLENEAKIYNQKLKQQESAFKKVLNRIVDTKS